MATNPKPLPRVEAQPIAPEREPWDIDMSACQLEYLLDQRARFLEVDHAEALRVNAAIDRERVDPEWCDRERRADRREARRLEERAGRS